MRRRLGAAARVRALEYFTVDGAINTFDEIYSFLGSGQSAADGRRTSWYPPRSQARSR